MREDSDEAYTTPKRRLTATSAALLRARSVHLGFTGILPKCASRAHAVLYFPGFYRGLLAMTTENGLV
jgi:hypothetical protein